MDGSPLRTLPVVLLTTLLAAGCAIQQSPVPLQGSPEAIRQLEGGWEGEYMSPDGGVLASISFNLDSEAGTATGDVLVLRRWDPSGLDAGTGVGALTGPPPPLLLQIEFVRCQAGTLRGRLEPYRDPGCDCMVYTEFQGVLEGDRIRGSFRMWPSAGDRGVPLQEGSWQMIRATPGR